MAGQGPFYEQTTKGHHMSTINTNTWTAPLINSTAPSNDTTFAAPVNATSTLDAASSRNATGFVPGTQTTTGGGIVSDLAQAAKDVFAKGGNAVDALVGMASTGIKGIEKDLTDAQASGKPLDATSISLATQKMSRYSTMMELAKKLQDSQEEATRVWVR